MRKRRILGIGRAEKRLAVMDAAETRVRERRRGKRPSDSMLANRIATTHRRKLTRNAETRPIASRVSRRERALAIADSRVIPLAHVLMEVE